MGTTSDFERYKWATYFRRLSNNSMQAEKNVAAVTVAKDVT